MCGAFLFFSLGGNESLSVYFITFKGEAQVLNEHSLFLHGTQCGELTFRETWR